MTIISLNFGPKEETHLEELKEIAGDKIPSKFFKTILFEYLAKYQTNPVLKERSEMTRTIEGLLEKINDAEFWNNAIQQMDPESLRILESASFSIYQKVTKKMKYGTVNAR